MNNRGMTLVEVLVTAIIALIVMGMTFSIVFVSSNQSRASIVGSRLSMHYDVAVSQIGQKARSAKYILNEMDTYPPLDTQPSNSTTIWMKTDPPTGIILGGYRINGSILEEYVNNAWIPFRVGNTPVEVCPSSGFTISADRKSVALNINIVCHVLSDFDTLYSVQEVFLCRN